MINNYILYYNDNMMPNLEINKHYYFKIRLLLL